MSTRGTKRGREACFCLFAHIKEKHFVHACNNNITHSRSLFSIVYSDGVTPLSWRNYSKRHATVSSSGIHKCSTFTQTKKVKGTQVSGKRKSSRYSDGLLGKSLKKNQKDVTKEEVDEQRKTLLPFHFSILYKLY